MSRSHISSRRRARSASAIARSLKKGWFKPPIIGRLNQPPRPLPIRMLRDIFLEVASTPPYPRRGISTPDLLDRIQTETLPKVLRAKLGADYCFSKMSELVTSTTGFDAHSQLVSGS